MPGSSSPIGTFSPFPPVLVVLLVASPCWIPWRYRTPVLTLMVVLVVLVVLEMLVVLVVLGHLETDVQGAFGVMLDTLCELVRVCVGMCACDSEET